MRFIEADCEIEYSGRGSTSRGRGVRMLILKDDGSFLIHKSTGVKPINYMTQAISTTEDVLADGSIVLTVSSKTESIDVIIYRKIVDLTLDVPDDLSKSQVNGTERQLQEWLSRDDVWPDVFGPGTSYICRELKTTNGAVDLTGYDASNHHLILIEVKRRANKNDVYQVLRYKEAVEKAMDENGAQAVYDKISQATGVETAGFPIDGITCWLVGESAHGQTEPFCDDHDVRFKVIGSEWKAATIDSEEASKTAVGRRIPSSKKRKEQGLF